MLEDIKSMEHDACVQTAVIAAFGSSDPSLSINFRIYITLLGL